MAHRVAANVNERRRRTVPSGNDVVVVAAANQMAYRSIMPSTLVTDAATPPPPRPLLPLRRAAARACVHQRTRGDRTLLPAPRDERGRAHTLTAACVYTHSIARSHIAAPSCGMADRCYHHINIITSI